MEISLSTSEFKALSSESRTRILKLLDERNHTLSELSAKTSMAAPTIKQHAAILMQSGLIELRDEGRKWKYYALTRKGKELLSAQKAPSTNILIILSSGIVVALLGFALMFSVVPLGSIESAQQRITDPPGISTDNGGPFISGTDANPQGSQKTGDGSVTEQPALGISVIATKCVPANADTNSQEATENCARGATREECALIYDFNSGTAAQADMNAACTWNE
ncbi:MAG TPA: winged helix-turn-helix transcriptional regulator [Candidatus Diapherotrites archaeon]|uniref:Winged helix-turn-helix transcriptional regulator n=1 Tax=Candidatus Iainarchaeum sp. TaxID=3101447 RepID=A0A7J4J006_9ARCH|nr:winged helix-turn-helix transcriptional regulator [Candidatus Diapherotrites archaeon]